MLFNGEINFTLVVNLELQLKSSCSIFLIVHEL